MEKVGKIAARELPFERLGNRLIVALERQQALLNGGQRREVVGRKDFALDDGTARSEMGCFWACSTSVEVTMP
jgi:hypothetical protein